MKKTFYKILLIHDNSQQTKNKRKFLSLVKGICKPYMSHLLKKWIHNLYYDQNKFQMNQRLNEKEIPTQILQVTNL